MLRSSLALALLLTAANARADVQTTGPQDFPLRFIAGISPVGGVAGFANNSVSGFKTDIDLSVRMTKLEHVTLWFGGGFAFTLGTFDCNLVSGGVFNTETSCGQDFELWLFVMATFEKMIPQLPIVPFVRAGPAGEIQTFSIQGTTGGGGLKVGAGAHYWLVPRFGVGFESNFFAGVASYQFSECGNLCFLGYFDFLLNARATF